MSALLVVDGAIFFVAMLTGGFKFEGCVGNAVLGEFFADGFFDVVGVSLGYHVERCVVVVSVHAPNVDVVNILHALDVAQMLANFVDFDAVGRFFKEQVDGFLEVANGIDKNEYCNADRHQGVDDGNIGKAHNDRSNENNEPTEDVLEHVQINRLLVERIPFPCKERRKEVDRRADDGKQNHSVVVDGRGVDDAHNGVVNNKNRAHQKNERGQNTADDRIARVAVSVMFIGLLFALFFKKIRGANACGVSNIVHGVGYDSNAARKKAADEFKYRKCEVENKCNKNISFGFHRFLPLFDGSIIAYSGADCNRIFSNSFHI